MNRRLFNAGFLAGIASLLPGGREAVAATAEKPKAIGPATGVRLCFVVLRIDDVATEIIDDRACVRFEMAVAMTADATGIPVGTRMGRNRMFLDKTRPQMKVEKTLFLVAAGLMIKDGNRIVSPKTMLPKLGRDDYQDAIGNEFIAQVAEISGRWGVFRCWPIVGQPFGQLPVGAMQLQKEWMIPKNLEG